MSPDGPSPDGRRAYVTLYGTPAARGRSVAVIDTERNAVEATLPSGLGPYGVAVAPDGRRVYVTDHGTDDDPGDTVSVLRPPG